MPNVRKVMERIEEKTDEILRIERAKPIKHTRLGIQVTKVEKKTENW